MRVRLWCLKEIGSPRAQSLNHIYMLVPVNVIYLLYLSVVLSCASIIFTSTYVQDCIEIKHDYCYNDKMLLSDL